MEEINEDDVLMYEESREIKETIWKIWDIINDKEIISKLILNTSLLKELKNAYLHSQENETKISENNNNNEVSEKNIENENGKYILIL